MRKTISLTLLFLTLISLMISCTDKKAAQDNQETVLLTETAVTDETTSDSWKNRIPSADFKGETFTVLVETNASVAIWERYWSAEDDGDVLNSAVFRRNMSISEYYNVSLDYAMLDDTGNRLYNSIMAGDYLYNLACFHMAAASGFVTKGIYANWYNMPNVDFSNPWWSKSNAADLSYKSVLFTAIGDYATSTLATTYCMFYNKSKAEDYNLGDIYQIVNDGAWTIDKLAELTSGIYNDLNNNGKADNDDFYGFVTPPATALIAYNWALGGQIFKMDDSGNLNNAFMSEHTVKMFEKVYSLLYDNQGSYTTYDYKSPYGDAYHNMGRDFLLGGQAVFINGAFDDALTRFREMDDDFGIIPYPKLDEQQENYYTTCNANLESMEIPANTPDDKLDMTGLLCEALCAESYETVTPAYYQKSLKDKAARDEETLALLDLIRDSRRFDFGYLYNFAASGTYYASLMQDMMNPKKPNTDITSNYEKSSEKFDKYFQDIFDFYDQYLGG